MPKYSLTKEEVQYVIKILKVGSFKDNTEISKILSKKLNKKINRRTISDINIGRIYRVEGEKYPINIIYTYGFVLRTYL